MTRAKIHFMLLCYFVITSELLAQGDTSWVRRYNGEGNDYDQANALVTDQSGNVYVTGGSIGSGTSNDYLTIKYASNGDTLWVRSYNGTGNDFDQANALAVDKNGNVCVAGVSWGTGLNNDYVTIKYAPNGDTLWVRRYDGPDQGDDVANALTVDDSGNVYVTGVSNGTLTLGDYATIKYSPNGDTLWVRRYDGPGNGDDVANAIELDSSGNIYITGLSLGGGTSYDYATIKYSPAGTVLWVNRYNGASNDYDQANALAISQTGNIYVTGLSYDTASSFDFATVAYAFNGDTLWSRRYNGPDNGDEIAYSMAIDGNGNIYVTGLSFSNSTLEDYNTIKYAPNGNTLWIRRYNGTANDYDKASALAIDKSGNVYVTGISTNTGNFGDYVTLGYTSVGDTLRSKIYNGPSNGDDFATAVAVDDSGNVYVTGASTGNGTLADYATIKYKPCTAKAGDVTGDGKILLSDIVNLINFLFKGQPPPNPLCRGDVNADGSIKLSDIVFLVNFLFKTGATPIKSKECCL